VQAGFARNCPDCRARVGAGRFMTANLLFEMADERNSAPHPNGRD
jgi:hypothetical protein